MPNAFNTVEMEMSCGGCREAVSNGSWPEGGVRRRKLQQSCFGLVEAAEDRLMRGEVGRALACDG
jgi:hypothetical protein